LWISLGNIFLNFSKKSFDWAIRRTLKEYGKDFDVIYCHFWAQLFAAFPYAIKSNKPLFVAAGEADFSICLPKEQIDIISKNVKGCICVATKNLNESVRFGLISKEKCKVIPNAIDPTLFYKREKVNSREALGFNPDSFIVVFVGQWNERKGIDRLSQALTKIGNSKIKAMFIGSGPIPPKYDNVIYKGIVPHEELAVYLNCADVFVLPTINEGCSNAIVEALACGLPIISSDRDFNKDILNDSNSIMIDPLDIDAIAYSILLLYKRKDLRENLSKGAIRSAREMSISFRADKIINFINRNK
jgi:glycosyltransferase involved in cell wall biosynthesis